MPKIKFIHFNSSFECPRTCTLVIFPLYSIISLPRVPINICTSFLSAEEMTRVFKEIILKFNEFMILSSLIEILFVFSILEPTPYFQILISPSLPPENTY